MESTHRSKRHLGSNLIMLQVSHSLSITSSNASLASFSKSSRLQLEIKTHTGGSQLPLESLPS